MRIPSIVIINANDKHSLFRLIQVSVIRLSNEWNVGQDIAIELLQQVLSTHGSKTEFHEEYVVRGLGRKSSVQFITIVPGEKLPGIEPKLNEFTKTLFSLSKKCPSNETINYSLEQTQIINLPLDVGRRLIEATPEPVLRPYVEKAKKTIFSVPEVKKKDTKSEKILEKEEEPASSSNEKTPQKVVKQESSSSTEKSTKSKSSSSSEKCNTKPNEKSTKSKPTVSKAQDASSSAEKSSSKPNGKTSKSKPPPKPQLGKASIANFFGNKPTKPSSTENNVLQAKEENKDDDVVITKEESPKIDKQPVAEDEIVRKRVLSSEKSSDDAKNEPSHKKAKKELKTKMVKNRSRIMAICDSDSSSDEDEIEVRGTPEKVVEEKLAENVEPEIVQMKTDEKQQPAKRRFKATRKVNKTYEDEDGFIRKL